MKHFSKYQKSDLKILKQYKGKDKGTYEYIEPCFCDTETSKVTYKDIDKKGREIEQVEETWVYLWGISVGEEIYYGRELREFFEFVDVLIGDYGINQKRQITLYYHNLPYDVSYMWDLIFKYWDDNPNVLALNPQQPFSISCKNGINLRCTYKLTHKSLEKWCNDLHVEHKKKVGLKDYNAVYNQTEPLPANELEYFEFDILSMRECFYKELKLQGYNFVNVPMTSTGFVRRIFQKKYRTNNHFKNYKYFYQTKPTKDQYIRQLKASQGGMTLGNIDYLGIKVTSEKGVGHLDFDSHYPTQLVCHDFPHKPSTIYDYNANIGINKPITEEKLQYYKEHNYNWIATVILKDVHIKEGVTAPFMAFSKVSKVTRKTDIIHINGKITSVKGYIKTTITNYDYDIFNSEYNFTCKFIALDLYTTKPLPSYILDTTKELYTQKNELKDIDKIEDTEDSHTNLMLKKAHLNGVFGCAYTRIVRDSIDIDKNFVWSTETKDIEEGIEKYYNNPKSCMPYVVGVFTTALARLQLFTVISEVIGYENFLYCDTDSAFCIITEENMQRVEDYNKKLREISEEKGFFVSYKIEDVEKVKYFNKFDIEKDHAKSKTFKALHAKCYALEPNGKLEIVVAGVPKYNSDRTLTRDEELGSIDNLQDGFVFTECGGTRAVYNCHKYEYNKKLGVWTGGGCAILDNTKTIHETKGNEEVYEELRLPY